MKKISILSLTETWLKDNYIFYAKEVCPVGYKLLRKDRKETQGGGVAVLCLDTLQPSVIDSTQLSTFENIITSIRSGNISYRLATVYRPPRHHSHRLS